MGLIDILNENNFVTSTSKSSQRLNSSYIKKIRFFVENISLGLLFSYLFIVIYKFDYLINRYTLKLNMYNLILNKIKRNNCNFNHF